MAGKAIVIHDPVSKDEIELTDKESKQYQEILNTAVQLEESHNKVIAEIQEDYKKFLKRNDQHYKKYKELEAELKKERLQLIVSLLYVVILRFEEEPNGITVHSMPSVRRWSGVNLK